MHGLFLFPGPSPRLGGGERELGAGLWGTHLCWSPEEEEATWPYTRLGLCPGPLSPHQAKGGQR